MKAKDREKNLDRKDLHTRLSATLNSDTCHLSTCVYQSIRLSVYLAESNWMEPDSSDHLVFGIISEFEILFLSFKFPSASFECEW